MGAMQVTAPGRYARITADEIPLLAEPGLHQPSIQVVGLAHRDEYFALVEARTVRPSALGSIGRMNFLNPSARNQESETWLRVVTNAGQDAWVAPIAAASIEILRPPPARLDDGVLGRAFWFVLAVAAAGLSVSIIRARPWKGARK